MHKSINAMAAAALIAVAPAAFAQNADAEAAAALADAIRAAGGTPAAQQAPAAPQPPVRVSLTPEEAQFVREEEQLLRQLRLATLRAQIAEAQGHSPAGRAVQAGGDSNSPVVVSRVAADPAMAAAAPRLAPAPQRVNADLPFMLASVWGYENNLTGEVHSRGLTVQVRKGDSLPGGWTVDTIARTGMLIRKGTATRTVMVGD